MGLISYCIYSAFEKASSPPENSSSPKASRGVKKRWSGIILKTLCWIQIKQKRRGEESLRVWSTLLKDGCIWHIIKHQTSQDRTIIWVSMIHHFIIRSIIRWLNRLKIVAWPQHFFIWTTGRMDHGNCWRCKNGVRSVLDDHDHDHDHGYPMKIPSVWIRELVPWLPFLILLDIACYGMNQHYHEWYDGSRAHVCIEMVCAAKWKRGWLLCLWKVW